uniref:Uncharacterized protein n=1 Tax=Glossina pallidipes TaxID=7398 RepID=A0A1A9Z2A0_GLOPL
MFRKTTNNCAILLTTITSELFPNVAIDIQLGRRSLPYQAIYPTSTIFSTTANALSTCSELLCKVERYGLSEAIIDESISKAHLQGAGQDRSYYKSMIVCSLFSTITNEWCALITGIYCYISDVAKAKSRALRMVLNKASLCAGMMVGNVLTGYIYEATNAITSKIREFFRLELVKDLVRTYAKLRPNYDRIIICLTMMALTLALFVMAGDDNVSYLFIFQFSIVGMTLISLASWVFESTVRATAIYRWELYLGLALGLMRGVMGPMSRAILSHVAPATEVGKTYALTTSLESLSPPISSPLYTIVYNATLSYYPGVFNFLSAGLYLLYYTFIGLNELNLENG